ncbi:hypothetical protein D3C73_725270 [compost metagenome]
MRQALGDFQRDRAGTFGDGAQGAVFDERAAVYVGVGAGGGLGGIEIITFEPHFRSEPAHSLHLAGIGSGGGEDHHLATAGAAGISEALAEIAGRGGNDRMIARLLALHPPVGAAALEGADRVERFHLGEQPQAEFVIGRLLFDQRAVDKNRINGAGGGQNAVGGGSELFLSHFKSMTMKSWCYS